MRILSGIQPSGTPHLGNYFGAILQHVESSRTLGAADSAFFFIADYHALTTTQDRDKLRAQVRDVAATYVALGLDVDKALLFRQSDVPEVCELMWLLSTVTGMGLLERATSYKDKVEKGLPSSVGLFSYPILMAADIVAYDSDVVPVGQDQQQHVEMTHDMVAHFNSTYKVQALKRPEWKMSPTPRICGTDSVTSKMSKSYNNTISIFVEGKDLKKQVNAIVTDSREPAEPKDPSQLAVFQILALFLTPAERAAWEEKLRHGGVGYGDLKKEIMAKMDARFGEARVRYQHLMTTTAGEEELEIILARGALGARRVASATLARCYQAVGMDNAARRRALP
ncbi:MAG: tryptophan--tRNA ligase [Deltaproteobacteria bacterium]|nr:tryptophan--tRNA ligase [Deltaproteobacteria bacterium]